MYTNMFTFPKPVKKGARAALVAPLLLLAGAGAAAAHVSEMGLVLLMPTGVYIWTGVWVVALTALALLALPQRWAAAMFATGAIAPARPVRGLWLISCLSAAIMAALIWAGLNGSRDPLVNPLPLMVWTVIWIGVLLAQAIVGDIWRILNPWSGPARLVTGGGAPFRLPGWVGAWPGAIGLMAFACFALADPAPDDPARLAWFTGGYWALIFCGCLLWGTEPVLSRCEFLTMTARRFAEIAPLRPVDGAWRIGAPGWGLTGRATGVSMGVFALLVLGVGSFDGLNETFWWLGLIGVNPLEFPGRSALIGITVAGLFGACALLIAVFTAALWLGLRMAEGNTGGVTLRAAFGPLALSVLPIGLAYHFAHYLTTLLVSGQYALAALTDPLSTGADILGLGRFYVTTSFFNTADGVEAIFTAQAGAVIFGHVLSVLIAHTAATRLFGDARRAAISQIPLAAFMVAYTFLGLWLLASPKGA